MKQNETKECDHFPKWTDALATGCLASQVLAQDETKIKQIETKRYKMIQNDTK
jgi:hypothetical protein